MFHITKSDLTNYISNPKTLTLHLCDSRICSSHGGVVMSFDELSKNKTIQELHITNDVMDIYEITDINVFDDIDVEDKRYIELPLNLKKLVLPNSMNDFYNVLNHCVNDQLQMPSDLEELVVYNMVCLENIKLNDKIQHVIVKCAMFYECMFYNESFYRKVFSDSLLLKSVKFYESNSTTKLEQMVGKLRLPYGCKYVISDDKYVG